MIFKEYQELVNKAGSRYGLVIAVTKRARDIKDGEQPLVPVNTKVETKPVTIATREFIEGKLSIVDESSKNQESYL